MEDIAPYEKSPSWWARRTRIEKCSLLIIGLCTVVIIYLSSNLLMKFPDNEKAKSNVCMSGTCIRSAASILEKMDPSINPCNDFYKFACGNFIKKAIIPDDKTTISSVSHIGEKVEQQLKSIFEEPILETDAKSLKVIKTVYKSCMNSTRIEKEGFEYVRNKFRVLGGWPVVEPGYWNEKNFDWRKLLYRLREIGWRKNFFISIYIDTDFKNSSKRILTITQPCFPYETLKKGWNETKVKAMYEFSVKLATLFGAEPSAAAEEMKEVMDFRMQLAKIMVPYENRKNISLQYNPMTIKELQRNFTTIPWLQYINSYLSPVDMVTSDHVLNVAIPEFLDQLEDLLMNTKRRVLANHIFSTILNDVLGVMPEKFRNAQLEYYKVAYGNAEKTPRWKECTWEVERLTVAVASVHTRRFVDKNLKAKLENIVVDIRSSFLEILKKIGWMDRKTKKQAILKAENMHSFVAYPDELLDNDKVEQDYEGLEANPNDFYADIVFNLSLFSHMKNVKQLRQPVIKPDWRTKAYTFYVNAFYDQHSNSIEIPAAILQDNFFDSERPQYMNYGAIGEVIGHEITHGFDDYGRQYDKDGNLFDWWEPETNKTFARKSQCLVEQYGNYTIPELNIKLNGVKNLGENIADNGGIKIAYKGYLKWMERNPVEQMLPGLPYTPRQMFWIASANTWCTKYKKEILKEMVTSGHHAPSYFRVVVPFMNSDYFAKDFNCPLGSNMNPKYKCRVW